MGHLLYYLYSVSFSRKYKLLETQMLDSVLRSTHSDWHQKSATEKSNLTQELSDKTQQFRVTGQYC